MAAELAQHKGGFAAQIIRYIDTVAHGNVGSAAAFDLAGGQGLAGLDGNRFPEADRVAIHLRVTLCAGEGNYRVAMEFQARAHQGGFKAGGAVMVADDAVGEPEGDIIHGAGWRHANVPVAGAAGVILHGGVSAGVDNFERHGRVVEGFQVTGRDGAGDDILVAQNLAQVIQVGGNTGQSGLRQCGLHLLQCILAIVTMDNQFGDHGIVMGAHHGAGLYPAVQTNVIREGDFGELAGAGLEIFQGIFGVNAYFHGRALAGVGVIQWWAFPAGQHQHPGHQIHPEYGFGDTVFYLQAGVNFQEIKFVSLVIVDIFHGAGGAVFHRLAQAGGAGMEFFAGGLGQVGCRGFFHYFLVAPLQGTLPLTQRQYGPVAVTENLHFHMAGAGDKTFNEDAAVGEEIFAQSFYGFIGGHQFGFIITARQADAATAGGAFQHDRITDIAGSLLGFFQAL